MEGDVLGAVCFCHCSFYSFIPKYISICGYIRLGYVCSRGSGVAGNKSGKRRVRGGGGGRKARRVKTYDFASSASRPGLNAYASSSRSKK